MKIFFLAALSVLLINGCTSAPTPSLPTVEKVDLERYAGKWIEIARYDNRFETGCAGATAEYIKNNNHIRVINSCFNELGVKSAEAIGRAYAVEESNNSKLKVSFFRPFYGDYWIIMLGDDYQYSVVGDPHRKYLWILSRTQNLNDQDKKIILDNLPNFGYDPTKLHWTSIRP